MGEAIYYLKATFESEDKAKEVFPKIEKFLDDAYDLYKDWQNNRPSDEEEAKKADSLLREKYTEIFQLLNLNYPANYCNLNYLAGKISVPHEECRELYVDNNTIKLSGEVWHFADWDNLADVFYAYGADTVRWLSDEYIDPWQLLDKD